MASWLFQELLLPPLLVQAAMLMQCYAYCTHHQNESTPTGMSPSTFALHAAGNKMAEGKLTLSIAPHREYWYLCRQQAGNRPPSWPQRQPASYGSQEESSPAARPRHARPPPPALGTRPPAPPPMSYRAPLPPASSRDHRPPLPPSPPPLPPAHQPPPPPPPHSNLQGDDDVDGVPYLESPKEEEKAPVHVKDSGAGKMKMGFGVLGKRSAKTAGSGIMIKMKPQVCVCIQLGGYNCQIIYSIMVSH